MAKRVKVAGISGNSVITADGQRLRIIGNAMPGGYVYTDGVVAYGYSLPGTIIKKPAKKAQLTLPLFCYANKYDNGYFVSTFKKDCKNAITQYGHEDSEINTMFCWYGRPYQFHAGNNVYALRGNYSNPSLYDADGNVLNVDVSKRLYLTHDRDLGFCWQKGGLCQTFSTWFSTQFQKIEYDREWDWHGGSHYIYTFYVTDKQWNYDYDDIDYYDIQCAIGNADITDLKVLYDNGVINLNPIVQQLLADALVLLKQKQAAAVDLRGLDPANAYPTTLPDPVIIGYWLGTNVSVVDDIFNGEHNTYPIDPDAGQGGNPLVDAKSVAYNATGHSLSGAYDYDCRVIHNLRKIGNGIEFYLNLRGIYSCYGYDTLSADKLDYDPVNEYTPAATADSWLWCRGSIGRDGQFDNFPVCAEIDFWYKVTITNGSASFQRIYAKNNQSVYKMLWSFTQHTREFDNDYTWTQTALNTGYIVHKTEQLPGNWLWVRDILQLGDNKVLVVGTYSWIETKEDETEVTVTKQGIALYEKDKFVSFAELYVFWSEKFLDGKPYNPNFDLITSIKKFKSQYEALINVPYYELDNQ